MTGSPVRTLTTDLSHQAVAERLCRARSRRWGAGQLPTLRVTARHARCPPLPTIRDCPYRDRCALFLVAYLSYLAVDHSAASTCSRWHSAWSCSKQRTATTRSDASFRSSDS